MAEDDTEVFQILIRQIGQDAEIDSVLGKTLGVLGHAEFFEPVCNLLHRRPPTDLIPMPESLPTHDEMLKRIMRPVVGVTGQMHLAPLRSGPAQRKVYHTR